MCSSVMAVAHLSHKTNPLPTGTSMIHTVVLESSRAQNLLKGLLKQIAVHATRVSNSVGLKRTLYLPF